MHWRSSKGAAQKDNDSFVNKQESLDDEERILKRRKSSRKVRAAFEKNKFCHLLVSLNELDASTRCQSRNGERLSKLETLVVLSLIGAGKPKPVGTFYLICPSPPHHQHTFRRSSVSRFVIYFLVYDIFMKFFFFSSLGVFSLLLCIRQSVEEADILQASTRFFFEGKLTEIVISREAVYSALWREWVLEFIYDLPYDLNFKSCSLNYIIALCLKRFSLRKWGNDGTDDWNVLLTRLGIILKQLISVHHERRDLYKSSFFGSLNSVRVRSAWALLFV